MILAMWYALEMGAVLNPGWVYYQNYIPPPDETVYYTEFAVEVMAFDLFFFQTTLRTDIRPIELTSWEPFWVTYDLALGVRVGLLEVGFRHFCTHPIQTYLNSYNLQVATIEGSAEEVYVRIGTLNGRTR